VPKEAIPAPVDRPLSRAYLREFSGWSTAYPPGLSDPTSLRVMENVYITREGACRVRPGIRSIFKEDTWLGNDGASFIVGSFEHFVYDSTGRVALLFGVRSAGNIVFKVVVYDEATSRFNDIGPIFTNVTFGAATTYIRYLQIDNKILALSDDPLEPAIIFFVGATKSAKKVPSVGLSIPAFTDVPVVVHPDAPWIDTAVKATRPAAETPTPQTLVSNAPALGTATVSPPNPAFTLPGHGLTLNQAVIMYTNGTPGGTTLYVKKVIDKNQFTLSSTAGGAEIVPAGDFTGLHFSLGPESDGSAAESANEFTFAYFYTFETEFGESAPSGVQTIKTQRGWSQFKFNSPDALGNPEDTIVTDPEMAMDQLVGMLPAGQYATAKAFGAVKWNLYQFTWNSTSPVPSTATLIGSKDITLSGTEATESWIINTAAAPAESYIVPVPNKDNRVNYSGGPTGRQGIAAGDRLTLVYDGVNEAVIKWSSNVPGEYLNFSPSKGGGQKTLSSGNLNVPLNVQLWQNPQAVDTLVIPCKGLNGYHAAYYMAPASVSGQSDSTLIMGFEQTTATPGTISPYGVEVLNNKLYHPLEAELMASTAANYSISHKTMTTDIANKWQKLADTDNIVSSQHDGRLYYVVHNPHDPTKPAGSDNPEPLEPGCMGNEIWVFDVGTDKPTWSRWKIQGISLHKLQIGNKLYMALVRPDAIFIFDEMAFADEYASGASTLRKAIPWKIETNTLGANRTHDAWAHVHQAQVHVGDWLGGFEWGIRAYDVNKQYVEKKKISHANQNMTGIGVTTGIVTGSVDLGDSFDQLMIGRELVEWTFFAQSTPSVAPVKLGDPAPWYFFGQIDFVQFLSMPASMNVGYEQGSIETFEYQRNALNGVNNGTELTRNGIAMPLDTRRP